MSEQKEQSGKNSVESFSDETIRLFLLSRLSEEERTKVEEELFSNDMLEERVRLAEFELTDDYTFGRLSAEERASFEKNFLVTNERKQKLKASRVLQNYVASQSIANESIAANTETKPSLRDKLSALFGFKQPAFVFAVSFAALFLLVSIVWFATKSMREDNGNKIAKVETPTPTPQPSPKIQTSPTPETSVSPKPTPKATPAQIDSTVPAAIASFVLLPGSLRDGGEMTRITLPNGERDIVRLELTLESNETGIYKVELLTAEGLQVLASNRNGADSKVVFDVPANLLKAGDYQIKLSRVIHGEIESVGRYSFRALKK